MPDDSVVLLRMTQLLSHNSTLGPDSSYPDITPPLRCIVPMHLCLPHSSWTSRIPTQTVPHTCSPMPSSDAREVKFEVEGCRQGELISRKLLLDGIWEGMKRGMKQRGRINQVTKCFQLIGELGTVIHVAQLGPGPASQWLPLSPASSSSNICFKSYYRQHRQSFWTAGAMCSPKQCHAASMVLQDLPLKNAFSIIPLIRSFGSVNPQIHCFIHVNRHASICIHLHMWGIGRRVSDWHVLVWLTTSKTYKRYHRIWCASLAHYIMPKASSLCPHTHVYHAPIYIQKGVWRRMLRIMAE